MVAEGHSDGIPFIVMERLENTLTNKLYGKKVKIPWPTAFDFAKQLAATFDYLHRSAVPGHSVIHRDLKVGRSGAHGEGGVVRVEGGAARLGVCGVRDAGNEGCGTRGAGRGVRGAGRPSSLIRDSPLTTHHPPSTPPPHHDCHDAAGQHYVSAHGVRRAQQWCQCRCDGRGR